MWYRGLFDSDLSLDKMEKTLKFVHMESNNELIDTAEELAGHPDAEVFSY